MPLISFIMMAKNEAKYINAAIKALQKESTINWELIVIDDHSTDFTFNIVKEMSNSDSRILLRKNKFKGKVKGTNFGYGLTKGAIIKCIDADDILSKEYFEDIEILKQYDAHYHDAFLVDENLNFIARQVQGTGFKTKSLDNIVKNIRSIPKAYWSFKREIAEKIFPMPDELPVEDEWISFSIKKYSSSILYINKPIYLYRQHHGQDYGGILNYSLENISFRAKRLIKVLDITNDSLFQNKLDLSNSKNYLKLQCTKNSLLNIFTSEINLKQKLRLMLIMHAPKLTVALIKARWKIMKK